jgi:hypothetical protein
VDLDMTQVVDGTLVKVMAWYDNGWGFTHQVREGPSHPRRDAGALLIAHQAPKLLG